jgi:hypothetical protein
VNRIKDLVLPSLLFLLTLALAVALGGAVVAAPWFYGDGASGNPYLYMFAKDMTVRRTAFFSALGMIVTAFVFFRPQTSDTKKKRAAKTETAGA